MCEIWYNFNCMSFHLQILISADDEMEESDVEEDLRRLTNLKSVKKKKHRFGLPV